MFVPTKLWYKGNKNNIVLLITTAHHKLKMACMHTQEWQTMLYQICSTKNPFDLRCKSITYLFM